MYSVSRSEKRLARVSIYFHYFLCRACFANFASRSWNGIKYIDPAESGAVLPILHLNGFKISERTIYGCMDDRELVSLFSGFGYQARIVEGLDDIDTNLNSSLEWALAEIRRIQKAARSGSPIMKPRWPMLILRTPKVSTKSSCIT